MSVLDFNGFTPEQEAAIREDMAAGLTFGPRRYSPADLVDHIDRIAYDLEALRKHVRCLAEHGLLPNVS